MEGTKAKKRLVNEQRLENVDALNEKAWEIMLTRPREALELSRQALSLSTEVSYLRGISQSRLNLGWSHNYLGSFDLALEDLHASLDMFRDLEDIEGEMKALNALGVAYHQLSHLDLALDYYNKSLEIGRKKQNHGRMAAAQNNIGEVSEQMGNYNEALEYFLSARKNAEIIKDRELCGVINVNLGQVYRQLNDYEKAEKALFDGQEYCLEVKDRLNQAQCLTVLGLIEQDRGRLKEAEEYHKKSFDLSEETGYKLGKIDALKHLGLLNRKLKKLAEAEKYFSEAVRISEESGSTINIYKCYRFLGDIYERKGDLEKSLTCYKMFYELEQNFKHEESARKLKSLSIRHEIEQSKVEAEVYRLKNIELKKKSEELTELYSRISVISEIGQEITASLDLEKLVNIIYERVNTLMDASGFGIATYNRETEEIEYRLFIEDGKRLQPYNRSINATDSFGAWCIKNNKEVFLNDIASDFKKYIQYRRNVIGKQSKSLIYIPLRIESRIVGVLTVQSFKIGVYSDQDLEILRALGSYIAIALENSLIYKQVSALKDQVIEEKQELEHAYKKIAHMANHDNLTGLPNRRLLSALLSEYIPLVDRQGEKLALLYLDLDDFKPINDNLGHEIGDEALKIISERLKSILRASDTIARIGGDEFVAILLNVKGRQGIEELSKKIIARIGETIELNSMELQIGVSIGICIYPDDGHTITELLRKADKAMYSVKQNSKSGYAFFSKPDLTI